MACPGMKLSGSSDFYFDMSQDELDRWRRLCVSTDGSAFEEAMRGPASPTTRRREPARWAPTDDADDDEAVLRYALDGR